MMSKRPLYLHGIGLFRGARDYTVSVKVRCPHGAVYGGRHVAPGQAVEIKLGKRASFGWQELIDERNRLQSLADKGLPLEEVAVPIFSKYAGEWLERKEPVLRSFGVTRGNVNSALIPTFGKQPLDAITVSDVNRWVGRQRVKLKPSAVQRQLNTFNAIMNDAVRNGLIERNPAERADKIKGIEARQRFVTEAEWLKIMETAERIEAEQEANKDRFPHQIRGWLRHYVVWAYESGMRRAEILALTWANVRPIAGRGTQIEVINTKTANPRHVTCTAEMEAILVALTKLERMPDDKRLFPVSMMTLKRSLSNLWKETGLPDVRLHDLRRTHATMMMQLGIDPKAIAGRLGHSGLSMLGRHYAVDRGDAEAVRRFEESRTVA
ncbi:MAG: tyrosine-type recombinase/integrase [Negativicutes bacterium]|nr:tyrosine-type recombinase/integrase [Negativicutes bacterium]